MSDGGKGSAPRKQRDDDAFRQNWETIFGKKKKETPNESESDKPTRNNDNH